MIAVTYFTDDLYRERAIKMMVSAHDVGIKAVMMQREDLGTWRDNLSHKPEVILTTLETGKVPMLYVDADSRFVTIPTEIPCKEDIALHFIERDLAGGGTIFVNYTEQAMRFLEAWMEEENLNPEAPDEENLSRAIHILEPLGLRVRRLPPAYMWVERNMRKRYPTAIPVIAHDVVHGTGR